MLTIFIYVYIIIKSVLMSIYNFVLIYINNNFTIQQIPLSNNKVITMFDRFEVFFYNLSNMFLSWVSIKFVRLFKNLTIFILKTLLSLLLIIFVYNFVDFSVIFYNFILTNTFDDIIIISLSNIYMVLTVILGFMLFSFNFIYNYILSYSIIYNFLICFISFIISLTFTLIFIEKQLSKNEYIRLLQYCVLSLIFVYYCSLLLISIKHNIFYYFNLNELLLFNLGNLDNSNIEPNMWNSLININDLFPIHSGPDSNINADTNLPSVATNSNTQPGVSIDAASNNITIDPSQHLTSIVTSPDKITVSITLDKEVVMKGIKDGVDRFADAAIDFIKNPGTTISAGIGLSAGAKAGVEIAKTVNHPAGKVATVVGTAALTSSAGVTIAETARAFLKETAEESVFNKPSLDNRAPSPTNDSSTMFSPLDDNNPWTITFTFESDGTTSAFQLYFNALIIFQIIMLLIFVYLSVLVIMQVIVNKHSDSIISFINRTWLPAWLKPYLIRYVNFQFNLHKTIYKYIIVFNILLFLICSIFSIFIISHLGSDLDYFSTTHLMFHNIELPKKA